MSESRDDEDLEAALRAGLRAFPATSALADGALTRLHGGFSNHAWRLEAPGGPWFARLGAEHAAALGVDRASECALLASVAAAGLAPEVLACEPGGALLVTRYVEGRAWQAADVASETNLRRLAVLLRRLHELPVPEAVATVSWSQQARRLASGLRPSPGETEIHRRAADIVASLESRTFVSTLCHHDVHHLNVLDDDERLWLVDWEYGGRGDPLMDLAGFLAMHDLGPSASDAFMRAYGRHDLDRGQIEAARWAFDYVQWLWYQRRFPGGDGDEEGRTARLAQRLLHCNNASIDHDHG